eukprot:6711829-Prymnesium_polylepis.1
MLTFIIGGADGGAGGEGGAGGAEGGEGGSGGGGGVKGGLEGGTAGGGGGGGSGGKTHERAAALMPLPPTRKAFSVDSAYMGGMLVTTFFSEMHLSVYATPSLLMV